MKNKLETFEMNAILYFIMRAGFIGITVNAMVTVSGIDSYLCPILGTIIGLFILTLYIKIVEINPDKNIYENIIDIFGKKIGKLIDCLIIIFIASLTVILYYDIINFIGSEYLYFTPSFAIAISLVIPIVYLLIHDLKVIARASIILFFMSFILYLLSILGLLNQVRPSNMLPILSNGFSPVIKGTLIYISYVVLPIFILTIIPKNHMRQEKVYNKKIKIYFLFISILLIISSSILIAVLGIDLAQLYQYPDYHLLRRITLGGFIQRVESLLAIQWVLCIYFMVVLCCFNIKTGIKNVFKLDFDKLLSFIIPLILMIFSVIIFKNNTSSTNFEIMKYPYLLYIFFLLIPLLILFVHKLKAKKEYSE